MVVKAPSKPSAKAARKPAARTKTPPKKASKASKLVPRNNLKPRKPPAWMETFEPFDEREEKAHVVVDDDVDLGLDDPEADSKQHKKLSLLKTHNFQESRKLTKADRKRLSEWNGTRRGRALDNFFRRQTETARTKFGHKSVYLGDETEKLVIGIPCPYLAFQFLIAQDSFPLGLVVQLVAKYGVGKSALLAEFGRWFSMAGGGLILCENETKFNPRWYRSILGRKAYGRMPLYRCKSVEDWQRKLTAAIKNAKADLLGTPKEPGPGRTVPIIYGIDSIMGKQSEETQEKIFGAASKKKGRQEIRGTTGDGHASRGHPVEAMVITRYMRTVPAEMDEWPFTLVLVNHLRIAKDDAGNPERSKAGGEQVNFQESFELELKKIGGHKKKIDTADFEGIPLEISCEKSSFGPTHRRIQTRLIWWDENVEGSDDWEQKTAWDWDWSTVHLLNSIMNGEKSSPRLKNALKEMDFHIACPASGDAENLAWSKSLGMKSEKEALSWTEVGAMIRENPKLMRKLQRALRINHLPVMEGDYLQQMEGMAESLT